MKQLCFLLALSLPAFCAALDQPLDPGLSIEVSKGFCTGGASSPLVSPKLRTWGSSCGVAQAGPLAFRTSAFLAPKYLRLYLCGYAYTPGLFLERASDGVKFALAPNDSDLLHWKPYDFALPRDWRNQPVRLVIEGSPDTWRAISEPLQGDGRPEWGDAIAILSSTSLHFFAIMIVAFALCAFAVLRGVRDTVQAGAILLVGTGLPGYLIFWLTLFSDRFGRYLAVLAPIAAIPCLFVYWRRLDQDGQRILRSLASPVLLTGVTALLVLSAGYLYGGRREPLPMAAQRFSHPLPTDNWIPYLVARGAREKQMPTPVMGDWLSSDRPPLQSGIVLSQFPLFKGRRELGYTNVSVIAQSLWILGLWLLLTAMRVRPAAIALVLAACLFWGFVFVNGFFVWPKLLAAAYSLGFIAAFIGSDARKRFVAPAALLCFSLLSHGGAVFALVAIAPILVLLQRPRPWKRMLAVGSLAFVLYLPWIGYQKFYDPPGDRLLKYHLAGVEEITKQPFGETLAKAYGALTVQQIASYKLANLTLALSGGFQNLRETVAFAWDFLTRRPAPELAATATHLRVQAFFFLAPALGFLLVGPHALFFGLKERYRTVEWRAACLLWGLTGASIIAYCLLMFGPGKNPLHAGPYSMAFSAMAACVLALWAVSPRLAVVITGLQIGLNVLMYGVLMRVPYQGGRLVEGVMHMDTLLLCCASATAAAVLLWTLKR